MLVYSMDFSSILQKLNVVGGEGFLMVSSIRIAVIGTMADGAVWCVRNGLSK